MRTFGASGRRTPARPRCTGDDGAALIEFSLLAPFLFLIIFGIIDFGYAFGQWLDVRHGAREGSRLVAVNYQNPTTPRTGANQTTLDIIPATCARMDISKGDTITIALPNGANKGAVATITVSKPLTQITGFLQPWLNGKTFSSTVQTRLEKNATFAAGTGTCP